MKKKLLVTLLSFVMVVTMMPFSVFASTANSEKENSANGLTLEFKANDPSAGNVMVFDSLRQPIGNIIETPNPSAYRYYSTDHALMVYDSIANLDRKYFLEFNPVK